MLRLNGALMTIMAPLNILLDNDRRLLNLNQRQLLRQDMARLLRRRITRLQPIKFLQIRRREVLTLLFRLQVVIPRIPMTTNCNLLTRNLHTHRTTLSTIISAQHMDSRRQQSKVDLNLLRRIRRLRLQHTSQGLHRMCMAMNRNGDTRVLLTSALANQHRLNSNTRKHQFQQLATNVQMGLNVRSRGVRVRAQDRRIIRTTRTSIMAPTITTSSPLQLLRRPILRFRGTLTMITTTNLRRQSRTNQGLNQLNQQATHNSPLLRSTLRLIQTLHTTYSHLLRQLLGAITRFLSTRIRARARLNIILRRKINPYKALSLIVNTMQHQEDQAQVGQNATHNINRRRLLTRRLQGDLSVKDLTTTYTNT